MAKITVEIPQESKSFLTDYIIFEDAAKNLSEAVNWCIDSCIKIEKKYGVDACYVAHNDDFLDEKIIAFGKYCACEVLFDGELFIVKVDDNVTIASKTTEELFKWWNTNIYKK